MTKRTIIFCGTPDFAVPSLRALAQDDACDIALVITQPDQPVGRKQVITPPPVKVCAEELGLPVLQPKNINEDLVPYLEKNGIPKPDFLVVVAYGKILKTETLAVPAIAPINVHASLLPRWRGASPIEHAILSGDRETGVTIQIMALELDAGDILSMEKVMIGPRETAPELRKKLSLMGAELLVKTLKTDLCPTPQPSSGITICRKLTKEDGSANPKTMTADEIDRRVRALNPWPGVVCGMDGAMIKLIETSLEPTLESIPLMCAEQTQLHLVMIQPAGKKPMSGAAWKRGQK